MMDCIKLRVMLKEKGYTEEQRDDILLYVQECEYPTLTKISRQER